MLARHIALLAWGLLTDAPLSHDLQEYSLKKLALIALASAFALTPMLALAANVDNGPSQPSAPGYQTYQYGQGQYLHTFSNISMTIPSFCTSVSANDVAFGPVSNALTPSATQPMQVSWTCVDTVRPIVSFQSATNKCHLVSNVPLNQNTAAANGIPYSIFDSTTSTTELCNGNAASPPPLYYVVPNNEAGTSSHTFYVKTGVLTGGGYATFPVGTYTDQVQVYLSF